MAPALFYTPGEIFPLGETSSNKSAAIHLFGVPVTLSKKMSLRLSDTPEMTSQPSTRDSPASSFSNYININIVHAPGQRTAHLSGDSRTQISHMSTAKKQPTEDGIPARMKHDMTNSRSSPVPDITVHHRAERGMTVSERRFWNSTAANITSSLNATNSTSNKTMLRNWSYEKSCIAAATIITTVVVTALVFLVVWYIRGIRRAKRLSEETQDGDTPSPSSAVTLTADTHKALEDFLMKDERPSERASLMFSRSRSPSFTFLVDETDHRSSMTRLYRTSYDASVSSLGKMEHSSSARVSIDGMRPVASASKQLSGSEGEIAGRQPVFGSASPRLSLSSTIPPTICSSQLWTTTTGSTEMVSRTSGELSNSHASHSNPRSSLAMATGSGSSRPISSTSTSTSNASHAPNEPSSPSALQLVSRMFEEAERSNRSQVSSDVSRQSPAISRASLQSSRRVSGCFDYPG